ncbi:MAG: preprotein translocase subunit SecY [Clostridia bacterium]|nr:preprotein translocase subunit SecY [Clostridia bacterium]
MIKKLKEIWGIKTLRNRIIFTLLMLAFIRLGNNIPTPGISKDAVESIFANFGTDFGMIDAITGGALQSMALFALGIVPYINASIIVQLLTVAIPALEKVAKDSDGRDKINKATRYFGIFLAFLQAFALTYALRNQGILINQSPLTYAMAITALTAGTAILVWIGDRITDKGLGNGTSLIIFVNILSSLPGNAKTIWATTGTENILKLVVIIACIVLTLAVVVYEQEAERRVPIEYAKRMAGRKTVGGGSSYIPLKLNISGVLPLIFAVSVVQFPQMVVSAFGLNGGTWAKVAATISYKNPIGATIYILLIFFFAYFYSTIQFNPLEFSENLKKSGGVIAGIRPGASTANYMRNILSRTTFIGAVFLSVIALAPILIENIFKVDLAFAGTSLIIAVGVAIEMLRQVDAHMISRNYQGFLK